MKKIISLLNLLFLVTYSSAQTVSANTDENYIYSKTCLDESCIKKAEQVQYFDNLGRAKQVISIKGTPSGKDVVSHIQYDEFGRITKEYFPVPQTGTQNGAIYTDPLNNAANIFGNEKIYSEKELENSPLGRIKKITPPGNDWAAHPSSITYAANTPGEVKKYTVSTSLQNSVSTITENGTYGANQLMKSTVTNGDGNTTTEFKNSDGNIILVRKNDGTQNIDTYYAYNDFGQLAFVIPPLAVAADVSDQAIRDKLCYQYRYDGQNRLIEKKIPGKGWEYMVYDKQDRLVSTQDAAMRAKGQWLYTKYDQFSRVIMTGISLAAGSTREEEQNNAYAKGTNNETRTSSVVVNYSGMAVYYTIEAGYPQYDKVQYLLSLNYYDTYPLDSPSRPAQVLGKNTIGDTMDASLNTKNLATASYVKNIEDDNWTKSYIWYDEKSRAVGTYSVNHLGGYTKTESELDFAAVVQQTKVYHKRLSSDTEKVITQTFEYDSQNRLKKQWHQVNSQPQELMSENTYNELSQLSNKKVGNNLQSIDYTYNIRGSITKVNDPAILGSDLFGYAVSYFDPAGTSSGKYSGNIKEVSWKSAQDQILRKYSYQYDPLNRMKKGTYSEPDSSVPQNNFFNETVGYDMNGNITELQRNGKSFTGTAQLIDNLTYSYTGNRLNSVTDSSGDYAGYPDTSGTTISYDENGNMKDHIDKGILQIDYNFLDLPDYVEFDMQYKSRDQVNLMYNVNTKYLYSADGTKLKKTYTYGLGKQNLESTKITEYLNGFQYENKGTSQNDPLNLKFVPTSEGYYNFENNKYIYSYTDHLGNVRLSYSKNTNGSAEVLEENNFYPFGLKHEGYNALAGNPSYKYGYNGKELQKETGWSDYGARMYMADIARWGVVDPLAETSRRFTPYNYALNNPISFIDPDGRKAMAPMGEPGLGQDPNSGWFGSANSIDNRDRFLIENGKGGMGPATFGQTEEFKGLMTYIEQSEYFKGIHFKKIGDDITVDKNGKVKSYVRNGKPNRFFDESGMELFMNDPEGVDKTSSRRKYNVGDHVYYPIDYHEFLKAIASVPNTNKIRTLLAQGRLGNMIISPSAQFLAYSLIGYESTYGEADFSAHYLSRKLDIGNNVNQNDSSYHIRFGNTNTIYSLMDAGNFMWGGWSKFIGLLNHEVSFGVNTYEFLYNGRADTNADSRSLSNGRKFLLSK
ncbi:RHS repeat-associated core domain-containing protein [Chryseobacterium oleae]|uniref:RHS repeat-associated core domain-containing protein n=1 Tax=Chryseobacterium oleae TaxID=491207 RepID=A0A1I4XQV5_CHROL|nr:DUF6443 domain-containing protein [Chryseobacterium oleae]SFN28224.1 RHS repeat-associated core domain-containing protein [Chryseobacterium oleae]